MELILSDIGWVNKIQVAAFAIGSLLFGAPGLHTAVEIESEELVHHFSRIERFGFCLYSAEEDFALYPEGRELAISGTEKSLLFDRPLHPGRGRVEDDALRAVYQWRWFDQDWTMENESDGRGLRVKVHCPWAEARVYLERDSSETVP